MAMLERPAMDKHSSLFGTFVTYVIKSFYNKDLRNKSYKTFLLSLTLWQSKLECLLVTTFLTSLRFECEAG
jgi:hypothetical protein